MMAPINLEDAIEMYVTEKTRTHIMIWCSHSKLFDDPRDRADALRELKDELQGVKLKISKVPECLIGSQYAITFNGKLGVTPGFAILRLVCLGLRRHGYRVLSVGRSIVLERDASTTPAVKDGSTLRRGTVESKDGDARRSIRDILGVGRRSSTRSSEASSSDEIF